MQNKKALYGARARTCVSLEVANIIRLKLLSEKLNLKISHIVDNAVVSYFNECELVNKEDKEYLESISDAYKK